LLSTARSLGRDYQVLSFKLDAEKRYLEKWAEVWIHGETIDPSHRDYRFAVAALAQISGVFAELAEYSSRYGITCDSSPTICDAIRNIVPMRFRQLSVSPHRHTECPPPPQAGLDRNSIELLTNPDLLSSDDIRLPNGPGRLASFGARNRRPIRGMDFRNLVRPGTRSQNLGARIGACSFGI
jgi:hypothetical protein